MGVAVANGAYPYGDLTESGGKLYGMTNQGGANSIGVLFEYDPATGTLTQKVDFNGSNGAMPNGSLTENGGKLYGMTANGGVNGLGVLFAYDPATATLDQKSGF